MCTSYVGFFMIVDCSTNLFAELIRIYVIFLTFAWHIIFLVALVLTHITIGIFANKRIKIEVLKHRDYNLSLYNYISFSNDVKKYINKHQNIFVFCK